MRNKTDRVQSFRQALLGLAMTVLATTLAAAPDYMAQLNYQGQLTDNAGEPVSDGTHNVIFRLYDAASAGNLLWAENQNVTVQKGLFNAILGQVTPLDLDVLGGGDGWLELEVNGNGPMTPRQQLQRAPFAHYAERLGGQPVGTAPYNIVQLDNLGKIPAGLVSGGSVSVPLDLSQNNSTYILRAQNTGAGMGISATTASGSLPAIYGRGTRAGAEFSVSNDISGVAVRASSVNGYASLVDRPNNAQVYGLATVASTYGVRGDNTVNSADATGVYGTATGTTAQVYGVRGEVSSSSFFAAGVRGLASGSQSAGVLGSSTGSNGYGVRAEATGASGTGVYTSGTSYGVISNGGTYGVISSGIYGVYGESTGNGGAGVYGYSENTSPAVYGSHGDSGPGVLGQAYVVGVSGTATETGVYGQAGGTTGIGGRFIAGASSGGTTGLWASTNSDSGIAGRFTGGSRAIVAEGATIGISVTGSTWGIYAAAPNGPAGRFHGGGTGIDAYVTNDFSNAINGWAQGTTSSWAIYGNSSSTSAGRGVMGIASGSSSYGVYGQATNASNGYGVYGTSSSTTGGRGVWGVMSNTSTSGYGGYFTHAGTASTAYGVRVESGGSGISVRSAQRGIEFDQSANMSFGTYWFNSGGNPGSIATYSVNSCTACYGGIFSNTAAIGSDAGYALRAEGKVHLPQMAGFASIASLLTSVTVSNSYVNSNAVVIVTPLNASPSTYWVSNVANGSFRINSSSSGPWSFNYLVINR
jgi:hypothetical protein